MNVAYTAMLLGYTVVAISFLGSYPSSAMLSCVTLDKLHRQYVLIYKMRDKTADLIGL